MFARAAATSAPPDALVDGVGLVLGALKPHHTEQGEGGREAGGEPPCRFRGPAVLTPIGLEGARLAAHWQRAACTQPLTDACPPNRCEATAGRWPARACCRQQASAPT